MNIFRGTIFKGHIDDNERRPGTVWEVPLPVSQWNVAICLLGCDNRWTQTIGYLSAFSYEWWPDDHGDQPWRFSDYDAMTFHDQSGNLLWTMLLFGDYLSGWEQRGTRLYLSGMNFTDGYGNTLDFSSTPFRSGTLVIGFENLFDRTTLKNFLGLFGRSGGEITEARRMADLYLLRLGIEIWCLHLYPFFPPPSTVLNDAPWERIFREYAGTGFARQWHRFFPRPPP